MRAIALVLGLAIAGCGGSVRPLRPFVGIERVGCARPADDADALELTYLGAGGFLFRWQSHRIMTAPFYSNPGLVRVGLAFPICPAADRIEALLPRVDDVEAMLVGHAHYDHLMDAVYVAQNRAPHARVYANATAVNILAATDIPGGVYDLEQDAGDETHPPRWVDVVPDAIRVMPLRSEHAPHFCGVKLFGGSVKTKQTRLPCTAYGWKEGQTLAFLIEFLRDGVPVLRLHYQDSASTAPAGFPPDDVTRADVAILCVASFANVTDYPKAVIRRLTPRTVVLGHYENFFRDPEAPLRMVPLTCAADFAERLDEVAREVGASWVTPRPGATVRLCVPRTPGSGG